MNGSETQSQDAVGSGVPGAAGGSARNELDAAAAVFVGARPRLFEIAYRILGSTTDAEDMVQDTWLRWQRTDRSVVLDPTAFLATTITRLALNSVDSARRRHETCAMPWMPEPAEPRSGPETRAENGEAVEHALLLLLQNLTPRERAAYILREAFDYPYQQIAEILRLDVANARQIARRAHQRIAYEQRRPVTDTVHKRFLRVFLAAAQGGNLTELEQLLAKDARTSVGRCRSRRVPRRRVIVDPMKVRSRIVITNHGLGRCASCA